jgi:hypothetical protein
MITLASTAAFDPTAWSNFTTAVWLSATVAIKAGSTALKTQFDVGTGFDQTSRRYYEISAY